VGETLVTFGSTMIEENVVSAAFNKFILNAEEFERLIRDAGYDPRRRNTRYELLSS
jgi:cyclic dehypoxanthinyl futalosine synthase